LELPHLCIDKTKSKRVVTAVHPPSLFSFETSNDPNTKAGNNGVVQSGVSHPYLHLSTIHLSYGPSPPISGWETSRNLLGVARGQTLRGVLYYNLTDLGLLTRSAGSPVHYWSVPILRMPLGPPAFVSLTPACFNSHNAPALSSAIMRSHDIS